MRVIYQTAVANINVAIGSTKELTSSQIQSTETVDYLLGGALTLRNGRIDKFQFDEGYCQASAAGSVDYFDSYYYDRDHLGNIRQVTMDSQYSNNSIANTIAIIDYYPSGVEMGFHTEPKYKYNGKEFDHMHGLNTYDYGARQYNPVTGRWDRMDPLSHKYYSTSPYAYCANNPIIFIDPDGRKRKPTNDTYNGEKVRVRHIYGQKRKTHIHKGVDINFGAGAFDLGAPVYATHSGKATVKSCKNDRYGAGNRVWVNYKCSDGTIISTGYFHLDTFTIQDGTWVNEGDQIGTIGNSAKGVEHYDTEEVHNTHNHYEVKVNGKNIDPSEEEKSDLIDTQELVKAHNSLPEVIVTPGQPQTQQTDPQQNVPRSNNPQI